jgi:hypothetical protein
VLGAITSPMARSRILATNSMASSIPAFGASFAACSNVLSTAGEMMTSSFKAMCPRYEGKPTPADLLLLIFRITRLYEGRRPA